MTVVGTSTIIYGSSQFVDVAQLIPSCDATVHHGMRMSKPGPIGTMEQVGRTMEQVGRSSARTPEMNAGMETAGTRKERELC